MIKTKYLENLDVVVHIASETVSVDEVIAASTSWRSHPEFQPDISEVWDLIAANAEVDWERLKQVGRETAERLGELKTPAARTAWVVSDAATVVVVESVHLAFPWATEWRTFEDPEEAIRWASRQDQ